MTSKPSANKPTKPKAPTRKAPVRRATPKPAPAHPLMINGKEWDRQKVVSIVCQALYSTSQSLRKILLAGVKVDGVLYTLPDKSTFLEWMFEDEAKKSDDDRLSGKQTISDQYARARERQVENFYDDLLDCAEDAVAPLITSEGIPVFNADGTPMMVVSRDAIAKAKLDSDNKKWAMERMKPKKYGARVNADHTHNAGKSLQDLLIEVSKGE